MKIKKHSYPPVHMGTPLMLVIFIILCMVIFAVLSLSTAAKDYNYSEKNAVRITNYYNACNQAEAALAEIDQIITESSDTESLIQNLEQLEYVVVTATTVQSSDTDAVQSDVTDAVQSDATATKQASDTAAILAEYNVSIDENEVLQVILQIHPEEDTNYTITCWKQVSTAEWSGDSSLPVLSAVD